MVKGRRTRQANAAGHMLAVAEAGAATDDTASPKRKDFKYDNNASHFTTTNTSKPASVPAEPMVLRGGRTKANGIAKYLTSCNGTKPPVTAVVASSAPKMDTFIDLTDENTCDSFDNNAATNSSAESPLAALGFNVIKSNPASNIFLQEPVLSLNFDKTPSDKSRVIIKNSFLTTEIQSKFSPPKCEPVWGDAAVAAAASNTVKREAPDYALDLSKPTQVTEIDSTTFLNQDSNSCDSGDSGVVILPSGTLEVIGTGGAVGGMVEGYSTRRKPATPHRILCPSPVKLPIVASPSTALAHMNIQNKRAARKNTKSKRRLHTKELENALEETVAECSAGAMPPSVAAMVIPVADAAPIKQELDKAKKPVLNDSVNPTAQQNTSNNNQSSKPPPSSSAEAPAAAAVISVGAASKTRTATTGGEPGGTNKKLTDFFQVRRSVRKTKKEVQWERDRDIEKAIREQREAGLKVANFEGKGRGIITTRPFAKGEFVVEYIGDLITVAEAKNREQIYAEDDNTGCYMYYFKHQNVQHCIDATAESGKLGRLVNHSRNGNLMTKTVSLNSRPHLVLIAKEDIAEGVEVTYDYGDRSKEALQHHPWLAF